MKHPNAAIEELLVQVAHKRIPAIDLALDRVNVLLAALDNPQEKLPPVVHVAGTNGKGSLLAYLKAILEAAGYKVHRYTSPHLVTFNERITLAGEPIGDDYLLSLLQRIAPLCKQHPVTGFEATTALAFLAFAETPADIVLLETGMGGRLDATNLIEKPLLTAITPISMDHTEFLGTSLASIAGEKAGIIKRGVLCVTGPQAPQALQVIESAALAMQAPLLRSGHEFTVSSVDGMQPALPGAHQVSNAATAIACAKQLKGFTITDEHIRQGIASAVWPARLQRLEGELTKALPETFELWLDGGHNPGAGEELAAWISIQQKPVHLICGMMATKDVEAFLKPMARHVKSLCAVAIEDEVATHPPVVVCDTAARLGMASVVTYNIKSGLEHIVKNNEYGIILICGSLLLAGNTLWQNGTQV